MLSMVFLTVLLTVRRDLPEPWLVGGWIAVGLDVAWRIPAAIHDYARWLQ